MSDINMISLILIYAAIYSFAIGPIHVIIIRRFSFRSIITLIQWISNLPCLITRRKINKEFLSYSKFIRLFIIGTRGT